MSSSEDVEACELLTVGIDEHLCTYSLTNNRPCSALQTRSSEDAEYNLGTSQPTLSILNFRMA
jgi:hypothetical protein